jgi:hypothetical protein
MGSRKGRKKVARKVPSEGDRGSCAKSTIGGGSWRKVPSDGDRGGKCSVKMGKLPSGSWMPLWWWFEAVGEGVVGVVVGAQEEAPLGTATGNHVVTTGHDLAREGYAWVLGKAERKLREKYHRRGIVGGCGEVTARDGGMEGGNAGPFLDGVDQICGSRIGEGGRKACGGRLVSATASTLRSTDGRRSGPGAA